MEFTIVFIYVIVEVMKRLPLFILFILFSFSGLLAAGTESGTEYFRLKIQDIISPGPDKFSLENESEITEAELLLKAEEEFSKMTLEEQVSLLFILQVDGKDSLSDFSKTRLTEIQPGGVLLFGYNISDDPGTLINFISEIKSVSGAENPVKSPLVFLDHEGGWVNRLRNLTWALPSARDVYTNLSFSNQYILYSLQATMLKLIGVDINLAPVAEPGTPFNNEFLDSRAPGEDISDAVIYSGIFVSAMESQGVGSVLKHFPGNTNKDPHKEIPVMEISKESFREILIPFKECTSLNPAGVLLSFVKIPAIDDNLSAFSPVIIRDILNRDLGFNNLVISDDLTMAAVGLSGYSETDAVIKALNAGCKMIMMSSGNFEEVRDGVLVALKEGRISPVLFREACLSVLKAKLKYGAASEVKSSVALRSLSQTEKELLILKTSFLSYVTYNFGKRNYGRANFIFR